MNNYDMAVMLYAVYNGALRGVRVTPWEDLTIDQRAAWQKVADAAYMMSENVVKQHVVDLEARYVAMRDRMFQIQDITKGAL